MKKSILFCLVLLASSPSYGGSLMFGKDQNIHVIEPEFNIPLLDEEGYFLTGNDKEQISGNLAYLVEIQFFLAGVWVKDKGYVLSTDGDNYYPISHEAQANIEQYIQKEFPSYSLAIWDYLFGYSLWIILIGVFAYYQIKDYWFAKNET